MTATATHIEALLSAAAAATVGVHALSFVVFLPGWQEGGGYQKLSASSFLRRRVLIAAADHGYCDGAAHQRQDPYRFSPYDTAVFVLQTDKASRKVRTLALEAMSGTASVLIWPWTYGQQPRCSSGLVLEPRHGTVARG